MERHLNLLGIQTRGQLGRRARRYCVAGKTVHLTIRYAERRNEILLAKRCCLW